MKTKGRQALITRDIKCQTSCPIPFKSSGLRWKWLYAHVCVCVYVNHMEQKSSHLRISFITSTKEQKLKVPPTTKLLLKINRKLKSTSSVKHRRMKPPHRMAHRPSATSVNLLGKLTKSYNRQNSTPQSVPQKVITSNVVSVTVFLSTAVYNSYSLGVAGGGGRGGIELYSSLPQLHTWWGKNADSANVILNKTDPDQQQSAWHVDTEHTPIHLYPKHVVYNF